MRHKTPKQKRWIERSQFLYRIRGLYAPYIKGLVESKIITDREKYLIEEIRKNISLLKEESFISSRILGFKALRRCRVAGCNNIIHDDDYAKGTRECQKCDTQFRELSKEYTGFLQELPGDI